MFDELLEDDPYIQELVNRAEWMSVTFLFTTPLLTPYNRSATIYSSFTPNCGLWLCVANIVSGAHIVTA